MGIIEQLAERKIREAMERGELDHLPGAGRPLQLEDENPFVPPELRMAYKVLKNAGFVPPEVALRKEIHSIEQLLAIAEERDEQARLSKRLEMLKLRLSFMRPGAASGLDDPAYREKLGKRLDRTR
ncbi:MAG: DUF1992 domain-containing protein [Zetaproteobacteria bacterium]|nr:MAG: DUF1992 domain-containing protein [Zetaproteobacteria bacterium]